MDTLLTNGGLFVVALIALFVLCAWQIVRPFAVPGKMLEMIRLRSTRKNIQKAVKVLSAVLIFIPICGCILSYSTSVWALVGVVVIAFPFTVAIERFLE